jgi:hypothetical protein
VQALRLLRHCSAPIMQMLGGCFSPGGSRSRAADAALYHLLVRAQPEYRLPAAGAHCFVMMLESVSMKKAARTDYRKGFRKFFLKNRFGCCNMTKSIRSVQLWYPNLNNTIISEEIFNMARKEGWLVSCRAPLFQRLTNG